MVGLESFKLCLGCLGSLGCLGLVWGLLGGCLGFI